GLLGVDVPHRRGAGCTVAVVHGGDPHGEPVADFRGPRLVGGGQAARVQEADEVGAGGGPRETVEAGASRRSGPCVVHRACCPLGRGCPAISGPWGRGATGPRVCPHDRAPSRMRASTSLIALRTRFSETL